MEFVHLVNRTDVPTLLSKKGYVSDTVQHHTPERSAVMKDVPSKQRREEYVLGMVPRSSSAVMKDVPTK